MSCLTWIYSVHAGAVNLTIWIWCRKLQSSSIHKTIHWSCAASSRHITKSGRSAMATELKSCQPRLCVWRKERTSSLTRSYTLHTWLYQHTETSCVQCHEDPSCDVTDWAVQYQINRRFNVSFSFYQRKNNVFPNVCSFSRSLSCWLFCINYDMYSTLTLFTNWSLDTNSFLFSRHYWCLNSLFLRSFFGSEQVQRPCVIRNCLKTDASVFK